MKTTLAAGPFAAALTAVVACASPLWAQTTTGVTSTLATEPALSPEAAALRAGLVAAAAELEAGERADVIAFYAARGYAPFWTASDPARGAGLAAALSAAGAHGLPTARYAPAAIEAALLAAAADPSSAGAAELAATRAYLRYARDVSSGLLTPKRIDPGIEVAPPRPERSALLARLGSGQIEATLAGLVPAAPDYAALLAEKARLEAAIGAGSDGPLVPVGPTMRLGDAGPRVTALRARLARLGYAAPVGAPDAPFDAALDASVQRFQKDAGLTPDGLAGQFTVAAINEGPEARLAQVLVNLERLRWGNRPFEPRRIVVNIPDFSVALIEGGETVYASRAVVGMAADTRTPEFDEVMTYFVVNPTWHIPDGIATRVYLPKLKNDPDVLRKNGMRLFTRSGTEIDPRLVDFTQFDAGSFPFRVKQNPSDANALGRVKFMFPNQFSIYLHDTPSRDLFAKDERAFSNGCVRLERPLELAYALLAGQEADPVAAFDGWLAAKSERRVDLARPIPVHIVYRTVFLDDDGAIRYRRDVYGRDAAVFAALEAAGVTLYAAQG